jgi:lipopolysaccharide export system permease protein
MVLWRYIIRSYLSMFFLSVGTFVWVLLVLRFKEIARFAALNGSWLKTSLFAFYQIPFILPMAVPFSALISSLLLFQRMSQSNELNALRASSLNFKKIFTPLCVAAAFLTLGNFLICAELAPFCRRASKTLFYQETSENPLLLLQRQKLVKLNHAHLSFDMVKEGKRARNFLLITPNKSHERLGLVSAKRLSVQGEELMGDGLSMISYLKSEKSDAFDPLLIENQVRMSMKAPQLSATLKKSRPKPDIASMSLSMLQSRLGTKETKEMMRRAGLSLAVFSFTFVGAAFGIEQRRVRSRKNLMVALGINLAILVCYFLAKRVKQPLFLVPLLYLGPHPIAWLTSAWQLKRIARGKA